MLQLSLEPEEAKMLDFILRSYLSDLRMEIAGTDLMDFREGLKKREAFLKKLIAQIEATVAP